MTATVSKHPNNENITRVGDNVRIEPGPKLVTAVATEELLHDNRTAGHYHVGGRDSKGRPIELGKEFTYLEWGGNEAEPKLVFYVYKKVPVNSVDEFIGEDEPNPHFVPQHVRDAATAGERGDDLVAFDYKWEEVGVRATYEAALDLAQNIADKL
jgi:hypothetical protein